MPIQESVVRNPVEKAPEPLLRPRCRKVRALVDLFDGAAHHAEGTEFELWGDREINPRVMQVLSDTPAQTLPKK